MGIADPHCHTTASDGMASPAELVAAAKQADLDLIAITDHDTMRNAREVRERGEEAGLAVVVGMEVTTAWPAQTHVLGWFLEEAVPSGRSLATTVDAIHAQGGLAVIPHPFLPTYFASCQPGMLERLIESRTVDAVEIVHTAPTTRGRQARLERFFATHADRLGARVGGSDCHFGAHDIGVAVTEFPGTTADEFKLAVLARTTDAHRTARRRSVPLSLLARQQWRSLVDLPVRRLRGNL
ncbi:MAG TPA: CehA/McbA family metallohydrolase [Candidatus Dormibacteraeota bacterium]